MLKSYFPGVRVAARLALLAASAGLAASLTVSLAGCHSQAAPSDPRAKPTEDAVELNASQLRTVALAPVAARDFANDKDAFGNIAFNDNATVQVFTNYQGRIVAASGNVGDVVRKGQVLFTVNSADLTQAASTLLSAYSTYSLTTDNLARARKLHADSGLSDKDFEQAVSDQATADAAYKAARATLRVFGLSEADIDAIQANHTVDPVLPVTSPIDGVINARSAQPGLFVQPGNAPAPFTVSDTSHLWMVANVSEDQVPRLHPGQDVSVTVDALPGQAFSGKVATLGQNIDPSTHTDVIRVDVADPAHALKAGMMARFKIAIGAARMALAIPVNGVVREGDGSMSVWTTADNRHFKRRTVTLGAQQDGFDEIVSGVNAGETVVTDGAVFLSNMANAATDGDN